jgi:hypothetical protein
MDTTTIDEIYWSDEQIDQWRKELLDVLDINLFIEWLEEHHKDEIVGLAHRSNSCPVYNYLQEKIPYLDCRVSDSCFWTEMSREKSLQYLASYSDKYKPPYWVSTFISMVDSLHRFGGFVQVFGREPQPLLWEGNNNFDITALEAYQVAKQIKQELSL